MKKIVPNLIRIETSHEPIVSERILLFRFNLIIDQGYQFPIHDFHCYSALFLRHSEYKKIPKIMMDGCKLKPAIKFELINFKIKNNEKITSEEYEFHLLEKQKILIERKKIIKREISKTNLKGKTINNIGPKNSKFYRTLLDLTREFRDITLLDWFTPIVLPYNRLIHIFVKHVEETKFGNGMFKKRTFFDYEPTEIWRLIKTLIKIEEQEIKDHFLMNSVNKELNRPNLMKDYRRNFRNPIQYNGDSFVLWIDKNGFIKQFYQFTTND